ncbi:MAG: hypothetical protein JZU64_02445 [Rhodoferax sp.]|nr:hypothetical protein [Rhodoferax sp.]
MSKAKIGFEVDAQDLANAKAFVARHGGSLNKMVSALFASLGQDEKDRTPAIDPSMRVLLDVCAAKISIMDAARQLELPDAGYVLQRLAEAGLPLPRLAQADVNSQLAQAQAALDECLMAPEPVGKKRVRLTKPAATT